MPLRMVTICSDPLADRRLKLVVGPGESYAFVAGGPPPELPFDFSVENLRWALKGLTYQAWGEGGYFALRPAGRDEVQVEFKSSAERRVTVCRMSVDQFNEIIEPLSDSYVKNRVEVL